MIRGWDDGTTKISSLFLVSRLSPVSRNEGALAFLVSMLGRSFASHWIASSPGTDRSRVDREIASQLFRRKLRNRKLEGG